MSIRGIGILLTGWCFLTFPVWATLSANCKQLIDQMHPAFDLKQAQRHHLMQPGGLEFLFRMPKGVMKHFAVHGIAKGHESHLVQLLNLLSSGIQKDRVLNTGEIGGGYRSPFVLTASFAVFSHPGKPIEDGFAYVVVDAPYVHVIPDLSRIFPSIKFLSADDAARVLEQDVRKAGLWSDEEDPLEWAPLPIQTPADIHIIP